MERRQVRVLEAFVRVRVFIDDHPSTGILSYDSARGTLDAALGQLRAHAAAEHQQVAVRRAAVARQAELVHQLIDLHFRPLVTIAREEAGRLPDAGLTAFRMPRQPVRPATLLVLSDATVEMARGHAHLFIANGLPADFLARFAAAREALQQAMQAKVEAVLARTTARQGLQAAFQRGRLAVERLDAVVRASFRGDVATLAAWRAARRVQRLPGGAGAGVAGEEEVMGHLDEPSVPQPPAMPRAA